MNLFLLAVGHDVAVVIAFFSLSFRFRNLVPDQEYVPGCSKVTISSVQSIDNSSIFELIQALDSFVFSSDV